MASPNRMIYSVYGRVELENKAFLLRAHMFLVNTNTEPTRAENEYENDITMKLEPVFSSSNYNSTAQKHR